MTQIKFDDLLKDMQTQVLNNQQTLYQNLISIITYSNKIPLNSALDSLTNLSESFMYVLPLTTNVTLSNHLDKGTFTLILTRTGRLNVFHEELEKYQKEEGDFFLGSVAIEPGCFDMITDLYYEKERRDNFFFNLIEDEIDKWHSGNLLNEKIDEVIDWVTRLETVYIYSGHKHFVSALLPNTTLERWNNLTPERKEESILFKLKNTPVENISKEEKILLVALHCLYHVGGPQKFEEFNGVNLTPYKLYNWLVLKYSQYFPDNSCQQMMKDLQNGIVAFSKLIGSRASEIDKTDYLRFRRMNGINFEKKEYFLKKDSLLKALKEIPEPVLKLAEQMKLEAESNNYKKLFRNIVSKAYEYELSSPRLKVEDVDPTLKDLNWMEYILYFIVKETAVLCDLDYCFTSGMKDISKLFGDETGDNRLRAISLEPTEMFCCFNDFNKKGNLQVCEGMQGNRWNYLGGNIDPELNKRQNRYCRFPLVFPDISIHNDFHHEGHCRLNIKHIFRVSGSLLDDEPLKINEIDYRAFFDIRGVRERDYPFSIKDLENAIRICKYLDVIWRTVVEFYETEQKIIPIKLFDSEFYKNASLD